MNTSDQVSATVDSIVSRECGMNVGERPKSFSVAKDRRTRHDAMSTFFVCGYGTEAGSSTLTVEAYLLRSSPAV